MMTELTRPALRAKKLKILFSSQRDCFGELSPPPALIQRRADTALLRLAGV